MAKTAVDPDAPPPTAEELTAQAEAARAAKIDLLTELTTEWEDNNHFHLRGQLVERWKADRKLRVVEKSSGVTQVTLAGIKAESTAGLNMALANWAMTARRELLELGDV